METLTERLLEDLPRSLISDAEGGLFLFYGDPALFALSPLLAVWRLELGERVLFLGSSSYQVELKRKQIGAAIK